MELFPLTTRLSQRLIVDKYERVINNITKEKKFHYEVILNSAMKMKFKMDEVQSASEDYAILNLFESDNRSKSKAAIEIYKCNREVSPSDYQRILITENKELIINSREIPALYGLRGDYLTEKQIDASLYLIRASSLKDGNLIFILKCSCEKKFYDEAIAEDFIIAVNSFRLLNPTVSNYAEKLKIYSIQLPKPEQFGLPVSFVLEKNQSSVPNTSFLSFNCQNDGKPVGNLVFYSTEKNDENVIAKYLSELNKNDIAVGIDEVAASPDKSDREIYHYNANLVKQKTKLVMSAFIIRKAGVSVFCSSIGPAFETDKQAWALNRRALDIVKQTLQIGEEKWAFVKK